MTVRLNSKASVKSVTVAGATVAVGAIQAALASVDEPTPKWLKATIAVLVYLGGGSSLIAASNVSKQQTEEPPAPPAPLQDTDPVTPPGVDGPND